MIRSPATAVATTRAGFGSVTIASAGARDTAGVKEAVADDTDHGGDRNQRREPRYDHHQPYAGGEARRGSIALGGRRRVAVGTGLLPFALRFSGG